MSGLSFRLSLTREATPLTTESSTYRGLAIDAHILELYANAVATFVAKTNNPYFIDPVLYRLTSDFFENFKDRRWADSLLEQYGLRDYITLNEDGVTAEALFPPGSTSQSPTIDPNGLVQAVLDYQRNRIPGIGANATIWDALEAGSGLPLEPLDFRPPEFLVAPSFIIDGATSLKANRDLAAIAVKQRKEGERIFGEMAISRDNLSAPVSKKRLIDTYGTVPLNGLLLWVADFRDWDEDSGYLEAFARFVMDLKKNGPKRSVYNLFGGYFSVLLTARGLLDASIQGVGISESRDPFAFGGGGIKRYYLPLSHQSVGVDIADDLQQVRPDLITCKCGECPTSLAPSKMSVGALARHFTVCRVSEYEHAKSVTLDKTMKELAEGKTALDQIQSPNGPLFQLHGQRLQIWANVLQKLQNDGVIS